MGNSVSYSLPATAPDDRNNEASGFQAMTQNQLNFAREAFEQWDDLIAINLNESSTVNAQITMANSSTTNNNGTYASSTSRQRRDHRCGHLAEHDLGDEQQYPVLELRLPDLSA